MSGASGPGGNDPAEQERKRQQMKDALSVIAKQGFGKNILATRALATNFKEESGIPVFYEGRQGGTFLIKAILEQDIPKVLKLIAEGAPVNSIGGGKDKATGELLRKGFSPLAVAVSTGNPTIVQILIENGANPNDMGRPQIFSFRIRAGMTPLVTAVEREEEDRITLERLRYPDSSYTVVTPAQLAAAETSLMNRQAILGHMLDRGAAFQGTPEESYFGAPANPLKYAKTPRNTEIVLSRGFPVTLAPHVTERTPSRHPLIHAITYNLPQLTAACLAAGVDPNYTHNGLLSEHGGFGGGERGETDVLSYAAWKTRPDILRLLTAEPARIAPSLARSWEWNAQVINPLAIALFDADARERNPEWQAAIRECVGALLGTHSAPLLQLPGDGWRNRPNILFHLIEHSRQRMPGYPPAGPDPVIVRMLRDEIRATLGADAWEAMATTRDRNGRTPRYYYPELDTAGADAEMAAPGEAGGGARRYRRRNRSTRRRSGKKEKQTRAKK